MTAPLADRLSRAEHEASTARALATEIDVACRTARKRYETSLARAESGPFAFFFRWLAGRRLPRLQAAHQDLAAAQDRLARADGAHETVKAHLEQQVASEPQATRLAGEIHRTHAQRDRELADAERAASMIRPMISAWLPLNAAGCGGDLARWRTECAQLEQAVAKLAARTEILAQWRAGLGAAGEELQREMVRYATVVGATCIGTATAGLLADLEFDLVIVDEAGQISTPNLLVPLVRGKRTLLVGDHHQLPPYLDEEIRAWADGLRADNEVAPEAAEAIGDMLRRSAFEQLYGTLPDDHQVMLRTQRRMPREIADFVSAAFYGGILRTDHPGQGKDPIFTSPFAMIDTSDLPRARRHETEMTGDTTGYRNEAEADLIVRLINAYAPHYKDWAVIVPYNAQADLIRAGLGTAEAAEHVGSVDSFQGGERDLIVYGFTRSNVGGEVGFLKELRRLNVAISRARAQLIVVGDTTTLGKARNNDFAQLMKAMIAHLARVGDLRPSREVSALIDAVTEV
ncbi:hypothetical protein Aple_040210 [Acrocarpospora pleiomorpha]|uniref:DNA helicase n=1 Tax=Acrocarpospora pleiomorpha TaxID=90975 RepID=A0A5M3XI01_9ACTN|nr:AAA domain-containing protein [Acrocarpospora pleiomorpha]GES21125.1 hypothetical protein Aple_040210 [Acrocarpospora pleiomorpha]